MLLVATTSQTMIQTFSLPWLLWCVRLQLLEQHRGGRGALGAQLRAPEEERGSAAQRAPPPPGPLVDHANALPQEWAEEHGSASRVRISSHAVHQGQWGWRLVPAPEAVRLLRLVGTWKLPMAHTCTVGFS